MKNKILIITGIVIVLSLAVLLTVPYEAVEHKTYVTVTSEKIAGINVDTDAVWFGIVRRGASSVRPIVISNTTKNSRVVIKATGDMAKWLVVSENKFKMSEGSVKQITIHANVPMSAIPGDYEGTIKFYFYRDLNLRK